MARLTGMIVFAGLWLALAAAPAAAQFQFSPERIFGYYDQDRDGELNKEEMERVRGPLRETLLNSGKNSVDREDFTELFEKQQRGEGGDRDSRRPSTSSSRSAPKLRERVTIELDAKYTDGDLDADGQIGLYEWIQWKSRAAIGEFLALDRNQDGFLTPYEVKVAEKTNGDGTKGGTSASGRSPTGSAPAAGGPPARPDAATLATARDAFKNLDKDGDGKLSEAEWQSSQATRSRFEQANVQLKLPVDLDTFLAQYPADRSDSDGDQEQGAARSSAPAGSGPPGGGNFRGGGSGSGNSGEGGGYRRRFSR